jgi:hypothetical protein
MNTSLATGLWVRLSEDVSRAIGRLVGYWRVSGITENGRLRVRSFDPDEPGEREVRKLRGVPVAEGDGVITIRLPRLFEVAVGAILRDGEIDGSDFVPEHEHPHDHAPTTVYEQAAATAAAVSSTTDTANFQEAISDEIALPPGQWTVKVTTQGNFSHSSGGSMRRAVEIDGALFNNGTVSLATARETYPVATERTNVSGGRTVTCRLLYHSNTAGTTACRAPLIQIRAEKE